ncbi:MAG: hypothetical protein WC603_03655 [Candidatus Paceibacterota bacterium]|jgi:hypothetical protein
MSRKIVPFILAFMIIFTPTFLVLGAGLVPDCNTGKVYTIPEVKPKTEVVDGVVVTTPGSPERYEYANPCDFNMVLKLINTVINFLVVTLATPLFALILVYVGWLYLSDQGSSENVKKAKTILKNAFIGYIIALAAWLIVKSILASLGFHGAFNFL